MIDREIERFIWKPGDVVMLRRGTGVEDYNPHHEPAGTREGGRFAKKEGGGGAAMADFDKAGIPVNFEGPRMEERFLDSYAKVSGGLPPDEFRDKFMGGVPNGMGISYYGPTDLMSFKGPILDEKGNKIGWHEAQIGEKDARLDHLELLEGHQGKGLAKDIVAGNVAAFKEAGMEKAYIRANIDVGGYAWAKYGFEPNAGSWNDTSKQVNERADKLLSQGEMTDVEHSAVQKALAAKDPRAVWPISDSRHGKTLLLDTDWHGELKLQDSSSMGRFNAYVARKR